MKTVQFKLNLGLLIILFGMMCLCTTKTFATCQAAFTWTQNANNVVNFTNASTGTSNQTFYNWNFGDGNYDYTQNPGPHTYSDSGTYVVCLSIFDSLNNCNSSYCDTIHVYGVLICNLTVTATVTNASCGTCSDGTGTAYPNGGTSPYSYHWIQSGETTQHATHLTYGYNYVHVVDANNCANTDTVFVDTCGLHASYTWTQPSNNYVVFTDASTGGNNMTIYSWDFGDGNYDYTHSPNHTYYNAGTYIVCLQISDSLNFNSCQSTFCDTIVVTGVNCNNLYDSLLGWDASCNSCADGHAYAYVGGGTPPYTYSWSPTGGTNASATGLTSGLYYCYVTDSNGCHATTSVFIGPDSCSAYFTLVQDSFAQHTYWAVNYATGAQPLIYQWTWGDNSLFQDSMPYPTHTYAQAGYYNICLHITDANGCQSTYCDSSYLQRNANAMVYVNVISPLELGIKQVETLSNWSVYPNPVSSAMTINYTLSNSTKVLINVFDMLGNKVSEVTNDKESAGQHTVLWNASAIPQGIYLMRIMVDNKILNQKITVMR
jgi:PKD repeat protein